MWWKKKPPNDVTCPACNGTGKSQSGSGCYLCEGTKAVPKKTARNYEYNENQDKLRDWLWATPNSDDD